MSNETKLVEALRALLPYAESDGAPSELLDAADEALAAHAAEAAQPRETMTPRELADRIGRGEKWKLADTQPQAQSGEWVMVPREPTEAMIRAAMDCQEADPADSEETFFYYSF